MHVIVQRKSSLANVFTNGNRTTTADEALNHVSWFPQGGEYLCNVHASHAQNTHDGQLGLLSHVQFVHDENGQNADGEITDCGKCAVDVGHGDDNVDANAVTFDIRVQGRPRPEIRQWLALQEHQEHEDQSRKNGQNHDGVEDPDMSSLDGNSHQENANGDLAENGGEAVCDFTKPPILYERRERRSFERNFEGNCVPP